MTDNPIIENLDLLQADLDDESPEVLAAVCETLLKAGARDAVCQAVGMKKGRPGTRLEVLARPADTQRLLRLLLTETSTLGVRRVPVERYALEREMKPITVFGQIVMVKVAYLDGQALKAKPEFEDCRRAAERSGRSLREVQAEAAEQIRREALLDGKD